MNISNPSGIRTLDDVITWLFTLYQFLQYPAFPVVRNIPRTDRLDPGEGDFIYDDEGTTKYWNGSAWITTADISLCVLRDGTQELTNDWDAGSFKIRAETFQSDVVTGTAPFAVASSTMVDNLNSEFLKGKSAPDGDIVGTTDTQTLTGKTITLNGATDALGSASVSDAGALTTTVIAAAEAGSVSTGDAGSVSTGDAGSTASGDASANDLTGTDTVDQTQLESDISGIVTLVNEIKSDYNGAVTLINEIKTDYNGAVTLINEIKSDYNGAVTLINEIRTDFNAIVADITALRTAFNTLLGELRKTNGCGVLND